MPSRVGLGGDPGSFATVSNCSTFVLTVFKSAGPKLVDPSDWPDRPEEDRQWQAKLARWLWPEAGCRHIKRVLPHIGRARIRPEETTGACLEGEIPANFRQCEPNGKIVLSVLDGTTRVAPRMPHAT
jgi:hypothetical protein